MQKKMNNKSRYRVQKSRACIEEIEQIRTVNSTNLQVMESNTINNNCGK